MNMERLYNIGRKEISLWMRWLTILLIAILVQNCIETVNFNGEEVNDYLVVDGKVNLNDSVQTMLLTHTDYVGRSARFPPEFGATVMLLENDKIVGNYKEIEDGVYKIDYFIPKIGNSYHIDIQLKNGEHYASRPEVMPAPVPIDSAYFIFDGKRSLTVFSNIQIPNDDNVPYLRWRISHVYQRSDLPCGGLDGIGMCYYENRLSNENQLLILLDGGELQSGVKIKFPILNAKVTDDIFGEPTYYTVIQESLTLSAFNYWTKANTLLRQTGSIFDAPPGQVRGNIYNVDDANALVLGMFSAGYEDYVYIKTIPSDFLPLRINPYCGFPGIPKSPLPYPECCVCEPGIPKPSYWR